MKIVALKNIKYKGKYRTPGTDGAEFDCDKKTAEQLIASGDAEMPRDPNSVDQEAPGTKAKKIVDEAKAQAKKIIDDAQAQVEKMLDDAQVRAAQIIDDAQSGNETDQEGSE